MCNPKGTREYTGHCYTDSEFFQVQLNITKILYVLSLFVKIHTIPPRSPCTCYKDYKTYQEFFWIPALIF